MLRSKLYSRLISNALWISLGVFLGRVAGFVREILIAGQFGVSLEADIAVVLLTAPDVLTNLLMGGALSAVLIPRFKRFGIGVRSDALFYKGTLVAGLFFVGIGAIASFHAGSLIVLMAPGLIGEGLARAENLLAQVVWAIPLTAIAGVSTAYLQSSGRFFIPAIGGLIFNIVIIFFILFSWHRKIDPLNGMVLAILVAASSRWLSQLFQVGLKKKFSWRMLRWKLGGGRLGVRYMQAVVSGGLIILLPVFARALASDQGEGYLSLFNYAYKLVEFPLGVCITALSVAVFPMLSQDFARGTNPRENIRVAIEWVLVASLSMTSCLWAFSLPIAQLVYERGAIGAEHTAGIASLFAIGIFSLPLQGVGTLLTTIFFSKGDTSTPLFVTISIYILYVPLGFIFSKWFGVEGVMFALVVLYTVLMVLYVVLLHVRHGISLWMILNVKRFLGVMTLMIVSGILMREGGLPLLFPSLAIPGIIVSLVVLLFFLGFKCLGATRVPFENIFRRGDK